jgi:RNA ligase (TIGR02306 family)
MESEVLETVEEPVFERKLATVRRVADIRPIPGADKIELITVDGWQVIAQKDLYQVGDLCVYCEIDSCLPIQEQYEFLRKSSYRHAPWMPNGECFRIKSMKMRGELSQGLLLPVCCDEDDTCYRVELESGIWSVEVAEGDDVTHLLGIFKWDPPLRGNLGGFAKGNFPSFLIKTDQERLQNLWGKYQERYRDHLFQVSLKLDGSSCTIYCKDGYIGVCSRNLDLKMDEENQDNLFVQMANRYGDGISEYCIRTKRNLAFQGELMGPGVQGNRENLREHSFYCFNIFDIDNQTYLQPNIAEGICIGLAIPHVPILAYEKSFEVKQTMQDFLEASDRPSMNHPVAEGLVYKSLDNPRVHFKVINNKFLLECED